MEFYNYMGYELLDKIRNGEITIQEVVQSTYERIESTDHLLHSYVNLSKHAALEKAKEYDLEKKKRSRKKTLWSNICKQRSYLYRWVSNYLWFKNIRRISSSLQRFRY